MGVYNVHGGHNSIVPGTSYYLNEVTRGQESEKQSDFSAEISRQYSI